MIKQESILYNHWRAYIKDTHSITTDAICYESEVRFSTDQKLEKAMFIEKLIRIILFGWIQKKTFDLIGFEWFQHDSVFKRLPVNPK